MIFVMHGKVFVRNLSSYPSDFLASIRIQFHAPWD